MFNNIINIVNNRQKFLKHIKHLSNRKSWIPLDVYKDGILSLNEQALLQTRHVD